MKGTMTCSTPPDQGVDASHGAGAQHGCACGLGEGWDEELGGGCCADGVAGGAPVALVDLCD
jgi:hypothetical protein